MENRSDEQLKVLHSNQVFTEQEEEAEQLKPMEKHQPTWKLKADIGREMCTNPDVE